MFAVRNFISYYKNTNVCVYYERNHFGIRIIFENNVSIALSLGFST